MIAFTRAYCPYCAAVTLHEWTVAIDDNGCLAGGPHHCCECGWERSAAAAPRSSWLSDLFSTVVPELKQIYSAFNRIARKDQS